MAAWNRISFSDCLSWLNSLFPLKRIWLRSHNGYCQHSRPFLFAGEISSLVRIRQGFRHFSITVSQPLLSEGVSVQSITWRIDHALQGPLAIHPHYSLEIEKLSLQELRPFARSAGIALMVIVMHFLAFNLKTASESTITVPQKVTVHLSQSLMRQIAQRRDSAPGASSLFRQRASTSPSTQSRKLLDQWNFTEKSTSPLKSKMNKATALKRHTLGFSGHDKLASSDGNDLTADDNADFEAVKPSLQRCLFGARQLKNMRSLRTLLVYSESGSLSAVKINDTSLHDIEACMLLALRNMQGHATPNRALKNRRIEKTFHLF